MKKVSKGKKLLALILCASTVFIGSSIGASAIQRPDSYNRVRYYSRDYDYNRSTTSLNAISYLKYYHHFLYDSMVTKGESNFYFIPGKTNYNAKVLSRSIKFFANGYGSDSVSFSVDSDGISASTNVYFNKDDQTIKIYDNSSWEYETETYISVLFNYGEIHETRFQIRNKRNEVLKTPFLKGNIWYK